ncbi:hypothetical protein SAMN05443665_106237 [Actinomadura meyerae]|jgi:hypothetical protein|uniref:Guanylate cyclase domain-containing protein n=1 Tax=Actinomadura meyerae TaxID=240840 RepID=A0A239P4M1_9ACTN|nr:hypothetical protein [Actinomadura meyerae]SNT61259.1 hypothetical protein SAMN05443665_106237 [Actinomadura meyerae]
MTIIPAPPGESSSAARLLFRLLLAIDIQGYSARSPRLQLQAQQDLQESIETAAAAAGLDRGLWLQQVSGDGELAVLPVDADIVTVIGVFAPALERALEETNRRAADRPRLRVRLSFHHGALIMGRPAALGPAGDAPVVVSRLLDARPLRRYLDCRPARNVALIVSDQVFREVVCSGFCALSPRHFQPIRTTIKGLVYVGYIYDPDRAETVARGGESPR